MSDVHVVINECTAVVATDVRAIRTRDTSAGARNWHFNADRLVAGLPNPLTDRELDWLEIHSAILAADRAVQREPGLGWNRSIELHVPVRDPGYWTNLAGAFEDIFASMTYDRLSLRFYGGTDFNGPPRQRKKPFPDTDCVALLSGGLDSFVGALELSEAGAQPLYLAASGSGATNHAQSEVHGVLRERDSTREMLQLICKRRSGFPGDEQSQRSRSFLYASAAALVGTAMGVEDVYVNENGIMAVHLPLTAARLGSFSTRTASPRVLSQMAGLASTALGSRVNIRNLLLGMTKGEVVARAQTLGHGGDVDKTVSCWSISNSSTHCGYCSPCVLRRSACLAQGVPDVDYDLDVLTDNDALAKPEAIDTLTHFTEMAEEFRDGDEFDLELDHPDLFSGASGLGVSQTIELYKRWADEILTTLANHPVPASLM